MKKQYLSIIQALFPSYPGKATYSFLSTDTMSLKKQRHEL